MSDPIDRPIRYRAALALLAAFALGLVCGAAILLIGQRSVARPHRPPPDPRAAVGRPMEQIARELELDADQRRAVRRILMRDRQRMADILEQSRLEIREILRPDQRERFDRMRPDRPGPRRFPRPGRRPGRGGPAPDAEPPPEPPD